MLILRNILALLLAFQVINPMCSCANEPGGDTCTPHPEKSAPSCCSSMRNEAQDQKSDHSSNREDDSSDDEKHLCMCPSDPNNTQDGKIDLPTGPTLIDLPELSIIELPDPLKGHPDTGQLRIHDSDPPPPRPSIRVTYSVFRL